eukprot:641219-Lingulodinium_polyedra.AAC.1
MSSAPFVCKRSGHAGALPRTPTSTASKERPRSDRFCGICTFVGLYAQAVSALGSACCPRRLSQRSLGWAAGKVVGVGGELVAQ